MSQMSQYLRSFLAFAALSAILLLSACSPKAGTGGDYQGESGGEDAIPTASEDQVKKAEEKALAVTKENHDMRREIFKLKNQLGIPVEQPEDSK